MAAAPGKRSPRKSASKPGVSPGPSPAPKHPSQPRPSQPRPSQPPLVDPETVAAVSRATARGAHAVVTASVAVAGLVARSSSVALRWLAPRLRTLAVRGGRGLWTALSWTGRWTWTHKRGVARVGHRVLWWGALAILIWVGRALLSADGDPELVGAAMLWFSAGLTMSVLILLGAPDKRMRVAAFALAGGHGSLGALAWIACAGV